jgi:hypothetical protein
VNAKGRVLAGWSVATALLVAGCGGGGGGGNGGGARPPNIAITTLDDGVVGTAYTQTVFTTGGTGQKTFSLSGSLPGGLALDAASGTISGTPAGPAGDSAFTITVTDSASPVRTDSQALAISIADPLAVNPGNAPLASIGVPYSHAIQVTGGTPPYAISGPFPSGLSADATGTISGTPAADAVTADNPTMLAVDSATPQQSVNFDLPILVELEVATTALPDATGGVSYSATLQARGGQPFYTWEMTGGNLPFSLDFSGRMGGTPDATCTASFATLDVRVTDADSPAQVATRSGITLTINPGVLSIPASGAPPVGSIGQPYLYRIAITPGAPPYAYAVIAGSLPPGLSLRDGFLTGTPAANGNYNFTVQVSDGCGANASRALIVSVRDVPTGRNDSIATATPISNGEIVASISPSGHPNTVFAPDQDYYVIQTTAPSTITVELLAVSGGIDTVIELVDAGGTRLQTCGPTFDAECMNDDRQPGNLDPLLQVHTGGPATFYIRVVEWRGDGRPDLRYRLILSGVN